MAFKSTTSSTTYANAKAAKDAQVEGGTVAQAGNVDTDTGVIKNDQSLINMNAADDSEATGPGSQESQMTERVTSILIVLVSRRLTPAQLELLRTTQITTLPMVLLGL